MAAFPLCAHAPGCRSPPGDSRAACRALFQLCAAEKANWDVLDVLLDAYAAKKWTRMALVTADTRGLTTLHLAAMHDGVPNKVSQIPASLRALALAVTGTSARDRSVRQLWLAAAGALNTAQKGTGRTPLHIARSARAPVAG